MQMKHYMIENTMSTTISFPWSVKRWEQLLYHFWGTAFHSLDAVASSNGHFSSNAQRWSLSPLRPALPIENPARYHILTESNCINYMMAMANFLHFLFFKIKSSYFLLWNFVSFFWHHLGKWKVQRHHISQSLGKTCSEEETWRKKIQSSWF